MTPGDRLAHRIKAKPFLVSQVRTNLVESRCRQFVFALLSYLAHDRLALVECSLLLAAASRLPSPSPPLISREFSAINRAGAVWYAPEMTPLSRPVSFPELESGRSTIGDEDEDAASGSRAKVIRAVG